jgi:RNA polymerase sigma-70 factor, ECF subfamily
VKAFAKTAKEEKMNRVNITDERAGIGEESQPFYSFENRATTLPTVKRHSSNNGVLNHKVLSDEKLARNFVESHDEEAFNEIVNRYGDKIYRTALRITHNPSDAEDVLQEVFIKLMNKLDTLCGESKFSTWLYRVAANASFMHLRTEKKKYKNEVSLENYVSYGEDGTFTGVEMKDWSDRPDEVLLNKETIQIIEKAVNELPVAYGIVFHLRDIEGLTNHEIAKILGLSLPNVKSRIHRTRLFLRDKLSDYFMNREANTTTSLRGGA